MLCGQTKTLDYNATDTESILIFYKTLYEQNPDSEMAQRFLVQHGLLPEEEAVVICEKLGINKKSNEPKPKSKRGAGRTKSRPSKKRRAVLDESSSDDEESGIRRRVQKNKKIDLSDEEFESSEQHDVPQLQICDCGTNRHLKEAGMDFSGEWIACDKCDVWFHADCYGLSATDVSEIDIWFCKSCR